MTDHLAEISGDPDDRDSDYGRGYATGWDTGYARGYEAGFRDASQPTSNQPVAGELANMRIIDAALADLEADDD